MPIKILLVDDRPPMLYKYADLLSSVNDKEGQPLYRILVAEDGLEALQLFKHYNIGFDLVVSGIKLPKMDGVELLKRVIKLKPELTVILHSRHAGEELNAEVCKQGAFAAFTHPVEDRYFLGLVKRAVNEASRNSILRKQ